MTNAREASAVAVIDGYQYLLECSERMLFLAREADWPALLDLEASYVQQVEHVSELDAQHSLAEAGQRRKAMLLERILENDREIRQCLAHRRDELGELIGTSQRQRDLQRAYGSGGGRVIPGSTRHDQGAS